MRRAHLWIALLAAHAIAILTGCPTQVVPTGDGGDVRIDAVEVAPPGSVGTPCAGPSDCTSQICIDQGLCSRACNAATDCPLDWECTRPGRRTCAAASCTRRAATDATTIATA